VQEYREELSLMSGMSNPHIAGVVAYTEPDYKSDKPHMKIVMERMDGDLESLLLGRVITDLDEHKKARTQWRKEQAALRRANPRYKRPPEPSVFARDASHNTVSLAVRMLLAYQAALGVAWLHQRRDDAGNASPVIHRDLKLASMSFLFDCCHAVDLTNSISLFIYLCRPFVQRKFTGEYGRVDGQGGRFWTQCADE
jgi:serine/threonine protein kinase